MPRYATQYSKDGKMYGDSIVAVDEASAKLVCSGRKRGEVIVGVMSDDSPPLGAGSTEPEMLGADYPVADAVAEGYADEDGGVSDDDRD